MLVLVPMEPVFRSSLRECQKNTDRVDLLRQVDRKRPECGRATRSVALMRQLESALRVQSRLGAWLKSLVGEAGDGIS